MIQIASFKGKRRLPMANDFLEKQSDVDVIQIVFTPGKIEIVYSTSTPIHTQACLPEA